MSGALNQTFDDVWGEAEQKLDLADREALRLVFMTGAATALNELRKGVDANGAAGVAATLKGLKAELYLLIGQGVVQ
jgi:hypothetical protein